MVQTGSTLKTWLLLTLASCMPSAMDALRPKFSWDTLGNMTFFHACNESKCIRQLTALIEVQLTALIRGPAALSQGC